jgi:hypothetical protein
MTTRHYATPVAFKQALEQRLKSSSPTGVDFARRRQLLVFDRFLARVTAVAGDAVTLKGGLVLELRLTQARTTKDIDLRMMGSADDVLERLQAAGRHCQLIVSRARLRPNPWPISGSFRRTSPQTKQETTGHAASGGWLTAAGAVRP